MPGEFCMSLQQYFPFKTLREGQRKVLLEIEDALKSGYKHIFLEAPVGFGKSPVAIAMARYLTTSHICTATKDLQAQYSNDFPFIQTVKGRGNFPCIVKEDMGLEENCEYGPCVQDDEYICPYKTYIGDYKVESEGTPAEIIQLDGAARKKYIEKLKARSRLVDLEWRPCHYFHQKWMGMKASHTIYNYRYFLSDLFYSGGIQKRKLLVLDEAHTLESEVSDFRSFVFYKNSLRFLPRLSLPDRKEYDIQTWIDFGLLLHEKLAAFIEQAEGFLERGRSFEPYTERNLIDAMIREKNLVSVLDDIRSNKDNWIITNVERDPSSNHIVRATLTPLEVSHYFDSILNKCSISLFMSATILSKEYLCKIAGLNSLDVRFIQVQNSDFPVRNRPIYLMNIAWLNAKTMSENLPKIAQAVDNIMTIHRHEKGIIHTTSYSQIEQIRKGLSKENAIRLIETGSNLDRAKLLEKHSKSRGPTVIISPSMYLGVDLKDDLSRFQIVVKVPYPDLADRKIAAMKQRDPRWYTWNTVLRLAQSYGRSVRNREDFAHTYILDSSISYLLNSAGDMIPKWFSEALVQK